MRKEGIAMNILFVCSGNTCRSAMAEGIAKQIIQSDPKRYRQIRVASAGTYTADGESASLLAKEVASKHGVDLEHFASKPQKAAQYFGAAGYGQNFSAERIRIR